MTEGLRNISELFVFSKCNNILSRFEKPSPEGQKSASYEGFVDYGAMDSQISHPAFVKNLFYQLDELDQEEPRQMNTASRNSSVSNIRENQESKYWFFKLHTDLLSIVNCIAKSVAKNSSKAVFGAFPGVFSFDTFLFE
jgi:hypothetical protein